VADITLMDVVAACYSQTQVAPPMSKDNTAVVFIDIQVLSSPEGMAGKAIANDLPEDQVNAALADFRKDYYAAVDTCSRVLDAAREHGIPPIHIKIEALSADTRDVGLAYKTLGWTYPPGSDETRILPQVAPRDGEIVLSKTVSSAFTGTNLDRVLRHMGITYLFLCGFYTDECIETAFRDAIDYSYMPVIVSDATATYFPGGHAHVMQRFGAWGLVQPADNVIGAFAALAAA